MQKKSILITGCSSGIGLRTAEILKKRGHLVFATARKLEDVSKLKARGLMCFQLDVNDSHSMANVLPEILNITQGKLDALFNNSGYVQPGAVEDLSRDVNRAQFETNVFGAMELIKLVLPIMRKQGHGRIIQNSSIMGFFTLPFYGAYAASKFALEAYSRALRQELRKLPEVYVSVINPGPIRTDIRGNAYQHYLDAIKNTASPYAHVYQKLEQTYFATEKKEAIAVSPDVVVKKVIHALESRRPRKHYYAGALAFTLAIIGKILPEGVFDSLLAKGFK